MGLILKHILEHSSGRLSYRRYFPDELRPHVPGNKSVHKVSLGKRGSEGFLDRYQQADADYHQITSVARRRLEGAFDILDGPRIAYLAELFRVQTLEEDDEARFSSEERDLFLQVEGQLSDQGMGDAVNWRGPPKLRWATKARETLESSLSHYRTMRSIGDVDGMVEHWEDEAGVMCEVANLVIDPKAVEPMRNLCRALNHAAISACEDRLRRLEGDDVPTPPEPSKEPREATVRKPTTTGQSVPLLALYGGYAAAQGVTAGVRIEWRRYIEQLIKHLGQDDASLITTEQLLEWRDALLQENTRTGEQRDPVTVKKYITAIRATLNWAVQERKLPANAAASVVVRVPKKAKLRERDFTEAEAKTILEATLRAPKARLSPSYARAQRWIPWLLAYTGARVNELSQLRGEDIQELEGIWSVRITPEAGTVKAKEARTVPLHEHLISQGFLAIVKANGPGPLFYEPSRQRVDAEGNRHFKKVGERLAKWVRADVGITDPGIHPNHAWRHTFKSQSYLVDIEERVVDAIQGHAPQTTGRKYGRPPLKALADAIAKLPRYQVDDT